MVPRGGLRRRCSSGSANAKLLDQFLSPFYNRRTDEFGGSLENRATVLRLIREAVAERAGADYPVHGEGAERDGRCPGSPHSSADDALAAVPTRRGVGLRRGDAGRGVGVPRHDAEPRRRARLAVDEQGHGQAAGDGRAVAGCAAACSRRGRGSAASGRRSSRSGTGPCSRRPRQRVVHPGPRRRRHPHRRRGAFESSTVARPTWSASAGRSTPSPTSPAASSTTTTALAVP